MNYGFPKINVEMQKMMTEGCEKILIFPMYPQYSATTTASVIDRVYEFLRKTRWQPTVKLSHHITMINLYRCTKKTYRNRGEKEKI